MKNVIFIILFLILLALEALSQEKITFETDSLTKDTTVVQMLNGRFQAVQTWTLGDGTVISKVGPAMSRDSLINLYEQKLIEVDKSYNYWNEQFFKIKSEAQKINKNRKSILQVKRKLERKIIRLQNKIK